MIIVNLTIVLRSRSRSQSVDGALHDTPWDDTHRHILHDTHRYILPVSCCLYIGTVLFRPRVLVGLVDITAVPEDVAASRGSP